MIPKRSIQSDALDEGKERFDEHRRECTGCERFFCSNEQWRQASPASAGCRRHGVDHSRQGLAAGRYAPRARGIGGDASEASEEVAMTYPKPPEFVAQGDRVLAIGVAVGKIKATDKPFEDHWVFDIVLQNGKLKSVREYIDTQALARASETGATPRR